MRTKKGKRKGAGSTSLDPNVLEQSKPSAPSREYGSTKDLAEKALLEQAARRLKPIEGDKGSLLPESFETPESSTIEQLVAKRRLSNASEGSRTSQTSFVSGPKGFEAKVVVPGTTYKSKAGRRRKTRRRKNSHRRR